MSSVPPLRLELVEIYSATRGIFAGTLLGHILGSAQHILFPSASQYLEGIAQCLPALVWTKITVNQVILTIFHALGKVQDGTQIDIELIKVVVVNVQFKSGKDGSLLYAMLTVQSRRVKHFLCKHKILLYSRENKILTTWHLCFGIKRIYFRQLLMRLTK